MPADSQPFDREKAKALMEAVREFRVTSVLGQTGYGIDHSKYPDFKAMQEICRTTFPAALAEIDRLEAENKRLQTGWDDCLKDWHRIDESYKKQIAAKDRIIAMLEDQNNRRAHHILDARG